MEWASLYQKYKTELFTSVVPFWVNHCPDEKYGGYFTFLDRFGKVYDTNKYMWMQWRIVYMFAWLSTTKYAQTKDIPESKPDKWLDLAKNGYIFLTKYGKAENNHYYFALNQKGQPIVSPYNIYSQAFAVMGSAALFNATGDNQYKDEALDAMDIYINRIPNPKGKWEKSLGSSPKRSNLGHYMILANLGSVIEDMMGDTRFSDHVDNAANMVINQFYNKDMGVIFENISQIENAHENERYDLKSCDGRHLNPGHGLEACWFLLEYAKKKEDSQMITQICDIIENQFKFGWDSIYGGIFYFMDALGKPHVDLSWDMKLWWVHNEATIAALYSFSLTKEDRFLEWFKKVDEWSWKHFPDKKGQEWFGYLNRRGEPTHFLKGGKWKTCFHQPRYLLKCMELYEKLISG